MNADQEDLLVSVVAGVGGSVQAAAVPLVDLGELLDHALSREVEAARLGGGGPEQEGRGCGLAEVARVAAVLLEHVEVVLDGIGVCVLFSWHVGNARNRAYDRADREARSTP